MEQIVYLLVHRMRPEIVVAVQPLLMERVKDRIEEQIVEGTNVMPQERMSDRFVEQFVENLSLSLGMRSWKWCKCSHPGGDH